MNRPPTLSSAARRPDRRLRRSSPWSSSGCPAASPANARRSPTNRRPGSPAVDAVVDRVNALGDAVYTADYDVVTTFDNADDARRGRRSRAPSRRSLTIGDVRYLVDGSSTRTCTVSTGQCVDTIDASRVSDVQMTPDFFGTSLSARLRHDAEVAVGEPTASTEEIAGPDRRRARRSPSTGRRTPTACSTTACSPASTPATSSSR